MKRYKYFRMKINLFPQDIIEEFNLLDKINHNGNVFCEVCCGMYMYGLPQAGIIAQELLKDRASSLQVSGRTIGIPSASPSSSMTLESNTSTKMTPPISLQHSRKIMASTLTEMGQDT
jgi:hypothetical protein